MNLIVAEDWVYYFEILVKSMRLQEITKNWDYNEFCKIAHLIGRSNSMLEQTRHQPSKSFPALTSLIILFESDPFSIPAIDSSDSGKECSTHENYDIVTDSLAFQMKLQLRQVVG